MDDELLVEVRGSVGILTVNRPERRNALRYDLWRRIPELIEDLDRRPEVRVIVIRGAGDKAFVAGADITEFEKVRGDKSRAEEYSIATERACSACWNAKRPVMAWIAGYCFGGGVSLALAADLRIAADNSKFAIPAARLGLPYEAHAVVRLVESVGATVARDMLFTGRVFSAEEALTVRLVDAMVPASLLEEEGMARAEAIASLAPLSVTYAKRAIDSVLKRRPTLDQEVAGMARACIESDDYQEGILAFKEKRPPKFVGR